MTQIFFELGNALRGKRSELGLTQVSVAKMSGLSRATVNQIERGLCPDLSLRRAERLLRTLGLSVRVADSRRADQGRTSAFDIAARTASVSFRDSMSGRELRAAIMSGTVPEKLEPHLYALLDEASVGLLARLVEEVASEGDNTTEERRAIWARLRAMARLLGSNRDLWA